MSKEQAATSKKFIMGAQAFLLHKTQDESKQDHLKVVFVHKQPYHGHEEHWTTRLLIA